MSVLLRHHPQCMGCGTENPSSLGLQMETVGDRVTGTVCLDERHTGAPGFAHGGTVAAVMDDLLGTVLVLLGKPAVTVTLTVDFRGPVLLERELTLEAWCERTDGRKLHLRGEIHDQGKLLAEGRALFLEVDASHWEQHSGAELPADWLASKGDRDG